MIGHCSDCQPKRAVSANRTDDAIREGQQQQTLRLERLKNAHRQDREDREKQCQQQAQILQTLDRIGQGFESLMDGIQERGQAFSQSRDAKGSGQDAMAVLETIAQGQDTLAEEMQQGGVFLTIRWGKGRGFVT